MVYTSLVEDPTKKCVYNNVSFRIEEYLGLFKDRYKDIYLIQSKFGPLSNKSILRVFPVGNEFFYVVAGTQNDAARIADLLYQKSNIPIGITKLDRRSPILLSEIQEQIDLAKEVTDATKERYHFYRPKQDSLEAKIHARFK